MALVNDAFCIDQYEGALEERDPDGTWHASIAVPDDRHANSPCRARRRHHAARLHLGRRSRGGVHGGGQAPVHVDGVARACRGPSNTTWPYGNTHIAGACNDAYSGSTR